MYGTMTRVMKSYKFNISGNTQSITFSSYPGFSYSFDDWYATGSGLLILETTNNIYRPELYELCDERRVMTWLRAPTAAVLAKSA